MAQKENYSKYYALFISSILLLILLAQGVISFQLNEQSETGMAMHVSGRQRTLAQTIAKTATQIQGAKSRGDSFRDELKELKLTRQKWVDSHMALINGSDIYQLPVPKNKEIVAKYADVNAIFVSLKKQLDALLSEPEHETEQHLSEILRLSEEYQLLMSEVVYLYSLEDQAQIRTQRWVGWSMAVLTIAVLVLAFMFLIRPLLSRLHNQNEELLELNRNLEKMNQVKSDFLANMSHEVRTPMNGVIGMADLLSRTKLDSEQKEYVNTIRNSSENLLVIINDILDYSKMENGKMQLESEVFSIERAIDDVFDLLKPFAHNKGLELMHYVEAKVPRYIKGDITRLKQVLINLINNAIKFTSQGEVVLKVHLQAEEETFLQLCFEVKDTGIGIEKGIVDNLFNSFTQADTSTTRKYGGTGLGLAICKNIVSLMGGRIWAESEPGVGSTFIFTIVAEKASEFELAPPPTTLQGLKALVVDDNTTNLKILVKQLSNWGVQATPFNSPELVLEVLDNLKKFDFCIIDMQMPEIDGKQLTKKIRKKYTQEELPIVVLSSTGSALIEDKHQIYSGYLTKPVKTEKLFQMIQKVVSPESHDLTQELRHGNFDQTLPNGAPLKILIAEDNPINLAVASKTLELLGYSAEKAVNGFQVLEKLSHTDYDLILMDVQMPDLDGLEATRKIKSMYMNRQSPVIIALTASYQDKDRKACLNSGMDDMLAKPINPEKLDEMIKSWFPDLDEA